MTCFNIKIDQKSYIWNYNKTSLQQNLRKENKQFLQYIKQDSCLMFGYKGYIDKEDVKVYAVINQGI